MLLQKLLTKSNERQPERRDMWKMTNNDLSQRTQGKIFHLQYSLSKIKTQGQV